MLVLTGLLVAAIAPVGLAGSAAAAPSRLPGTVEVTLDQSQIETVVGQVLTVESRIVNSGQAPTDRLVAHVNVVSLNGVYVDLEDWSAEVTQAASPLAPGNSRTLSWKLHAVNAGSFDVYVVVLPAGSASAGATPLVVSPPVHVTVAGRRTLTAAGSLPVAIIMPTLLGLLAATGRYRLRRRG